MYNIIRIIQATSRMHIGLHRPQAGYIYKDYSGHKQDVYKDYSGHKQDAYRITQATSRIYI